MNENTYQKTKDTSRGRECVGRGGAGGRGEGSVGREVTNTDTFVKIKTRIHHDVRTFSENIHIVPFLG